MTKPFANLQEQMNQSIKDMRQSCPQAKAGQKLGPRSKRLVIVIESTEAIIERR